MPQFAFIAKDRMGNTVQGKVDAPDTAFAANQVGQMGYALIELRPVPASPAEPTTNFAAPPYPSAEVPTSPAATAPAVFRAADPAARTQSMAAGSVPTAPVSAPLPSVTLASPAEQADLLRSDAAARRKAETDLARMGMKPDEIRRLLDANPNTTAPPPTGPAVLPTPIAPVTAPAPAKAKKENARLKVADRAADLHSFAAQLQSSSAATQVKAVEAVTLDLPDFRPSTPQERQQAETILRECYALRRRERFGEALAKCREALNLVPADAAALEMYGDLLQGVARTNEALAAYKRATEADSARASAERKYGDLLMRQQQWNEVDTEEVPKNPVAAAALSMLFPGAGQIHNGEKLKGAVLLTCAALCVAAVLYLTRDKMAYAPSQIKPPPGGAAAVKEKRVPIDWGAETPLISCIIFYTALGVGSAIDAAAVARRTRRGF